MILLGSSSLCRITGLSVNVGLMASVFVGTGASSPKGRKKMTYCFDYYDQNSFSKRKYGFVFWYKARSLKYTPIQMGLTTYSIVFVTYK